MIHGLSHSIGRLSSLSGKIGVFRRRGGTPSSGHLSAAGKHPEGDKPTAAEKPRGQSAAKPRKGFPAPAISVRLASIDSRQHSILATLYPDEHRQALQRGKWICCDCGISMPGWMEVHAVNGNHFDMASDNLVPICHYCHLARHPVAAARTGALTPIWWAEMSQAGVNRLAWALMAVDEMARKKSGLAMDPLLRQLRELDLRIGERQELAAAICGTPRLDALLEGLFEIRRFSGPQVHAAIVGERLADIRFWPRKRIRVWKSGRIEDVTQQIRESFLAPGGMLAGRELAQMVAQGEARKSAHARNWQNFLNVAASHGGE